MLYEMLSEQDINLIKEYIEQYGIESSISTDMQNILSYWDRSKKSLYHLLGDNFILNKKVSFFKNRNDLMEDINNLRYNGHPFFIEYYNKIANLVHEQTGLYGAKLKAQSLLDSQYLATNIYEGHSFEVIVNENKTIKIETGCKVSKALNKLSKYFNFEHYEDFRIKHSQILNLKKSSGELCLSIHPLDFMTMSDNNCGWESCMSWVNHGDYCSGTVEMMNSPCVIVGYLKSSKEEFFNWNSKKWRCLYIVIKDIIISIKEYPYIHDELNMECLKWIKELAYKNLGWEFKDERFFDSLNVDYNAKNFLFNDETPHVVNFYTDHMYNDMYGKTHMGYLSDAGCYHSICYSGACNCMKCGAINYNCDKSSLVCDDCDDNVRCCECGCRIHDGYEIYANGSYWCEYCFDNYYTQCPSCGVDYYEGDERTITLKRKDNQVYERINVCPDCYSYFVNNCLKSGCEKKYGYLEIIVPLSAINAKGLVWLKETLDNQ